MSLEKTTENKENPIDIENISQISQMRPTTKIKSLMSLFSIDLYFSIEL